LTAYVVDISHHDWDRAKGEIDWPSVAGITAVCVRATYGDPGGYNPPTRHYADMARGAHSVGLIVGAYHNLVRGDSASIRRQVDYLRSQMGPARWAMLDVERYPELLSRGVEPRFGDVQQFCARWRTVDSRPLLVYLPKWVWSGHLGSPDLRPLGCPLVASDYGPNMSGTPASLYAGRGGDAGRGWAPYGKVTPALWQYGSKARVPGLAPPTDINAFRGSAAQLRTLLTEGDDMPTVDEIASAVADKLVRSNTVPWTANKYSVGGAIYDTTLVTRRTEAAVAAVRADLAAYAGRDPVDEQAIADAVLAGLTPEAIADRIVALLPADLAGQVVTLLGQRLAQA
jgi:hypothetical protein